MLLCFTAKAQEVTIFVPKHISHTLVCRCANIMGMDTQNVTLRVPKVLLAKTKELAAARGTNVTALVIESLTRLTSGDETYDAAWQRQRALMRSGERLRGAGERFAARESLHER